MRIVNWTRNVGKYAEFEDHIETSMNRACYIFIVFTPWKTIMRNRLAEVT